MMYDPNFPNRPGPYDDPLRNKLLNRKIPENDTAAGWSAFAAITIAPASSHIRNIRNIRNRAGTCVRIGRLAHRLRGTASQ